MHSSDAPMLADSILGEPHDFSELTTFNQVRMLENKLKSVRMQNVELDKRNTWFVGRCFARQYEAYIF